jgi:hypothetical protein
MKIIMAIGNLESVCCEVPDKYLESISGYSDQQNLEAREKIISMYVEQAKRVHQRLIDKRRDVRFWLSFESSMNYMDDAHLDRIKKMSCTDIIL